MDEKNFAANEILFKEGDAGNTAFLVVQGSVQVSCEVNGKETVLGEIKPGQILGEMALINKRPRMATAKAVEETVCVVVSLAVFEKELGNINAFMKALMLNLIGRLRDSADMPGAAPGAAPGAPVDGDKIVAVEEDGNLVEAVFYLPGENGKYHKNGD